MSVEGRGFVLDTNVIVSAAILRSSMPDRALRRARQRGKLLLSTPERIVACRDPRDDKFLELAVAGTAAALVTGDADLIALDPFRGIPIVTPAAFLERFP
jgi:predicted nucleic acid-binding protein